MASPSNQGFTFFLYAVVAGTGSDLTPYAFPTLSFILLSVGAKTGFLTCKLLLQLRCGHVPGDSGNNCLLLLKNKQTKKQTNPPLEETSLSVLMHDKK